MIYLRTTDIPELKPWNQREIHEAWAAVFKEMHRVALPWIGYAICVAIPTGIGITFPSILGGLLAGPGLLLGVFIMSQFQLHAAKPLMKKWLEDHHPKDVEHQTAGATQ